MNRSPRGEVEFRHTSSPAPPDQGDALSATDPSSLPGVIDLITPLPNLDPRSARAGNGHADDLDGFERYYAEVGASRLRTADQSRRRAFRRRGARGARPSTWRLPPSFARDADAQKSFPRGGSSGHEVKKGRGWGSSLEGVVELGDLVHAQALHHRSGARIAH